ncbi:MAG: TRAP transporter small permease [Desulfovibrionaceae bacterium]|nr:TRAP transporter small permease [Desulfovibrionaceae bacterium]
MWTFLDKYCEELIGSAILALMVTIAFINVVVRYCSSFSFAWSEEITTNLFVWVVLLGTSCAFRDRSHLSVNLLYSRLPVPARVFFTLLVAGLSITFFLVLGYTGVMEILDEIELERVSDSLELPYWIYSGAVPLFSLLIVFRIAQRTYRDFRDRSF